MKSQRRGLGRGRGSGYSNLIKTDKLVHHNAGLGKKTYSNPIERKMSMTAPRFTPVIFRKWKAGQFKGDIDAIFPDQVADLDGNVSTYTHVGQHGSGDFNFMLSKTVPAKPSEYAELETELESIGYRDLKSYMKDIPQFQQARRKQLEKDSDGDGVPDKFDCKPFDKNRQDKGMSEIQKTYSTPTERKLTQGAILKRSPFFSSPKPFEEMPPIPKGWGYLPIKTSIIVPSTNKQQKFIGDAQLDKRVEETQRFMSVHFGGYTDIKAEGGYVSGKSGKVLKDKTVSVIGFASAENFLKHRDELKEWMMNKVSEWGQETLGFEFEDDLYYIKGKN